MATKTVTEPVDHDAVRDFVMECADALIKAWSDYERDEHNQYTWERDIRPVRERLQSAVEWAMARARVEGIAEVRDALYQGDVAIEAEADAAEKWSKLG